MVRSTVRPLTSTMSQIANLTDNACRLLANEMIPNHKSSALDIARAIKTGQADVAAGRVEAAAGVAREADTIIKLARANLSSDGRSPRI